MFAKAFFAQVAITEDFPVPAEPESTSVRTSPFADSPAFGFEDSPAFGFEDSPAFGFANAPPATPFCGGLFSADAGS